MTVRKKRSEKSESGADSTAVGSRDIGWGVGADSARDDLFMRKVLFSVLFAVIGCMGVWFMLTTLGGRYEQDQPVLSANGSAGAEAWFTVKLVEFPPDQQMRGTAEQLASHEAMQRLADGQDFCIVPLPDGTEALCVGRFTRKDSPELQRLLARCLEFSEPGLDFPDARILPYSE